MNATDDNATSPGPLGGGYAPNPPRLVRSTDDKIVAGLCGGLGRHFGVDPVVFRIAFVVMALAGGSGVLLYLVGWLLVPDDHSGATILDRARQGHRSQVLAAVLLAVGAVVVFDHLGDHGGGGRFGGLVLLGVGAAVLWSRRNSGAPPLSPPPPPNGPLQGSAPPAPWAPAPPQPLSAPGPETTQPGAPEVGPDPGPTPTLPIADAADTATAVLPPGIVGEIAPGRPSGGPTWPVGAPAPAATPRPCRPRSVLAPVALCLTAILGGVLALLGATGTVDVPVAVGLALALLLVGGALLVGAWRGRARWLIPLGMVLGIAVIVASAVGVPLRGGIGDPTYGPKAVSELQSPYRLAAGDLLVDLSALDLTATTEKVVASVGAGDLQVVVPDGAEVVVDAHVSAGNMTVFDRRFDGMGNDRHVVEPGREGGGRLVLSASTGFGHLEVRHASS